MPYLSHLSLSCQRIGRKNWKRFSPSRARHFVSQFGAVRRYGHSQPQNSPVPR